MNLLSESNALRKLLHVGKSTSSLEDDDEDDYEQTIVNLTDETYLSMHFGQLAQIEHN